MHGQGVFYFTEGSIYTGNWDSGERNGGGKLVLNNNEEYDGNWENGKLKGHCITFNLLERVKNFLVNVIIKF